MAPSGARTAKWLQNNSAGSSHSPQKNKNPIHIAFESRVYDTRNESRNPSSSELETWKKLLIQVARDNFSWADTTSVRVISRDNAPTIRVVTFHVPTGKGQNLRNSFANSTFTLSAVPATKGFDTLGEVKGKMIGNGTPTISPLS